MKVRVTGWQMSGEDAARARAAKESELPKLTAEQQKVARGFEMSDEQYARILLAGLNSHERLMKTAERMAATIERELPKAVPEAEPELFQYEVGPEKHLLLLRYNGKPFTVEIDDDSDDGLVQICRATAIMLNA